jgi:hypothetical protein
MVQIRQEGNIISSFVNFQTMIFDGHQLDAVSTINVGYYRLLQLKLPGPILPTLQTFSHNYVLWTKFTNYRMSQILYIYIYIYIFLCNKFMFVNVDNIGLRLTFCVNGEDFKMHF